MEVVSLSEADSRSDLVVHDETNKVLAQMLAAMEGPDFPVAVGVIYREPKAEYVTDVHNQLATARSGTKADINALLNSGHTWTVE